MIILFILFQLILCDINSCIGSGVDTTKAVTPCLAQIYIPTTIFNISIPESQLIQFNVVMQSYFDVSAYYDQQTDTSGFLGFATSSEEVYKFYSNYYQEQKSLTKIVLTIAFTKVISPALPFPQLSPEFIEGLSLLPNYNPKNKKSVIAYTEFILTWGTAVIDQMVLGGKFETNLWYDSYFNSVYTEEKITESSGWSFAGIIGDGHGHTSDNHQIDKKFNATLVSWSEYLGGNVTMDPDQYLDWASTVQDMSTIISYHLIPITYFIKNQTIMKNMQLAIADYEKMSQDNLDSYINKIKNHISKN